MLAAGPDVVSCRDNGTCFKPRWAEGCERLGIAVRKTRPYRPQTNGCECRRRFRLGPLPGSRRCCLCVTRPNGWLVSMPLL